CRDCGIWPAGCDVIADALTRRELVAAGIAVLVPTMGRGAEPKFPTRNIQFIIPYAAGGGFDAYVRFVSPVMEQYLPARASIVPVNIAAASGSRGISQLYRAKPDGYTIGIFDLPGMFIEQSVQGNNAYDLSKFAWAGQLRIIASFALHSSIPGIPDATTLGKPELDQITVERPVAAAPGTPQAIQNILSMALAKALRDRKVVTWAAENDVIMTPKTPRETEVLVARERVFFERWKKYLLKV